MLTGFICVVVSMNFYQLSIMHCEASIVAILFSCNPVFVVPLAYFLLDEKVDKLTILSVVFSISGMIFILNPLYITDNGNEWGFLFALLSAVTFALYGILCKKRSEKYGGIALTSYSFLMGCTQMFILILLSRIGIVSAFLSQAGLTAFSNIPIIQGINMHNLINLIYVSIFITGLGYMFYFSAMEETSAITASVVFFIKPALAPVLALIILHESIAANTIAGMVFIIAGSCITFVSNRRVKSALT
ncbi:MAG: EamA family transporter [Bacillota bacterium]|nr:EamA family transporter [Bacillota bacterium]